MAKNTESPSAGRSAEMVVNIENTESYRASRPARIAINLQFRHFREFPPLGFFAEIAKTAETAENVWILDDTQDMK